MGSRSILQGHNPACVFILPMLNRKPDDYPQFRDCFVSGDMKRIIIYTRAGSMYHGKGYGEEKLFKDPNYIKTYDDETDNTYGYFEFKVPEENQADFDSIIAGEVEKVSEKYIKHVKKFYPSLAKRGTIDMMFHKDKVKRRRNRRTESK